MTQRIKEKKRGAKQGERKTSARRQAQKAESGTLRKGKLQKSDGETNAGSPIAAPLRERKGHPKEAGRKA